MADVPEPRERHRLWVVSELYYPEDVSTGHFLTGIAEGLVGECDVGVLCSQPSYSMRGVRVAFDEVHNGVRIHRVRAPLFDKNVLPLRIFTSVLVTTAIGIALLRRACAGDRVLVVTNPPMLPYVVAMVCRLKGASYSVLVHDVYPDVLIAVGMVAREGMVDRMLSRIVRWLYDGADHVIVLGRDMASNIGARMNDREKVRIIPNWGDDETIAAALPRDSGEFIVQYLGNMGRTHDIETIVEAARRTRGEDVRWTFIGDGAKRRVIEQELASGEADNIALLDRVPAAELPQTLAGADISIVSFVGGMAGISVPSRVYNVMCAARPILLVADAESEVSALVREHGIGWVVAPGDSEMLARIVRELEADRGAVALAGAAARALVEVSFSRRAVIALYRELFRNPRSAVPA